MRQPYSGIPRQFLPEGAHVHFLVGTPPAGHSFAYEAESPSVAGAWLELSSCVSG
ncbi:MAG: hypothetical protein ABF370_13545 [Verrucomicrobiales bacterium]|nr:hypothetical protein [Verrucomicrobiaceae bacterium]